jgi:hypothetical protein
MTTHITPMPARRVRGILAAVCAGAFGVAGLMALAPHAHAAQGITGAVTPAHAQLASNVQPE